MNRDEAVVADFGDEWARFDQSALPDDERDRIATDYFQHVPWDDLPDDAVVVDIGCGSGRWAAWLAPRVARLIGIDASPAAAAVARSALAPHPHTGVVVGSVGALPLPDASADLVYSLGVLHHVPDTAAAVRDCARLLKPGGVLYVYLYYSMENRPAWYRALWRASDLGRRVISTSPRPIKNAMCDVIALVVYWPLSRSSRLAARVGISSWPLASYARMSVYSLRTDARDRFGTRLEQRFSRAEVAGLLRDAGLIDVRVPETFPYWIGLGRRPRQAES